MGWIKGLAVSHKAGFGALNAMRWARIIWLRAVRRQPCMRSVLKELKIHFERAEIIRIARGTLAAAPNSQKVRKSPTCAFCGTDSPCEREALIPRSFGGKLDLYLCAKCAEQVDLGSPAMVTFAKQYPAVWERAVLEAGWLRSFTGRWLAAAVVGGQFGTLTAWKQNELLTSVAP